MKDLKNTVIAIVASIIILFVWQYFYEIPKIEKQQKQKHTIAKQISAASTRSSQELSKLTKEDVIANIPRVKIKSDKLDGSISLQGARVDDIIFPNYPESLGLQGKAVSLLAPSKTESSYFVEFGWLPLAGEIDLPNSKTIWNANKSTLSSDDSVILSWENNKGILFEVEFSLDKEYMFTVQQRVKNSSSGTFSYQNYALINRVYDNKNKMAISHEGPIGVFNKILKEIKYDDLESDGAQSFYGNSVGSWMGISDKYWLTAIIPDDKSGFDAKFQYNRYGNQKKYQADYISSRHTLSPGEVSEYKSHLFVGAKVVSILDRYANEYNIDLFDRAVDFGWFYFITKPMFNALKYFYNLVGNFGISILIVTIIVKLVLFPLANRSYKSMNRMKELQPEMSRIRELYSDDKMKQNQSIMEMYKKQKVNPLSGCLPLFVQIPIFFSLYKVLFITIEMRHAPFYGWIADLSAPDPTTIFNLFGLIPWSPPSFLMIGIWPIIMALTMYLQQKMSPEPSDPMQAKMMKLLPLIFVFMFASFPAGLVIYWAWSNTLSIVQQYVIKLKYSS